MADYWREAREIPGTLSAHPDAAAAAAAGLSILDLGCGEGRGLAALPRGSGPRCGLDANLAALGRARRRLPGAFLVLADLARIPLASDSFDAACLTAVMTVLTSPEERLAVLGEARRVVRRRLFVSDFLLTPEDPYYRDRYERGLAETGEYGSFLVRDEGVVLYQARHYVVEELTALLENSGWTVDSLLEGLATTRSGKRIRNVRLAAKRR